MLMVLALIWVQAILLAPLGGGPLAWDLWRHYTLAVSSMVVLGVFLGQMILTQALPKSARIVLFAFSTAFLAGVGPWLQRAYEAQSQVVLSKLFLETVIADFGPTRYYLLVGGIFAITLARSLRFR